MERGVRTKGFKDYDEMCIVCHSAPGKERRPISKGMRPQPPNLAKASTQWTNAQLFWIIKNGVKMTGMQRIAMKILNKAACSSWQATKVTVARRTPSVTWHASRSTQQPTTFNVQRHLTSARTHRVFRASAMQTWREDVVAA